MLAAGVTFALLDQQAAKDLDSRFHANTLTTADAAKYRTVATYNVLAPALLIGGGVVMATGLVLWGTAPSAHPTRGVDLGVQGRF